MKINGEPFKKESELNSKEKEIVEKVYKKMDGCHDCRKQNRKLNENMVGIWHYGDNFESAEHKILFVGKTAIMNDTIDKENFKKNGYVYYTNIADNLYQTNYSAFWHYIKDAIKEIYMSENEHDVWEKVAVTNLIKCNTGSTNDETTESMKKDCSKIFLKELEYIKPKHIIFMTGKTYVETIKRMFNESSCWEILNSVDNNANIKFNERFKVASKVNNEEIECIIIGHPQGKKKNTYIKAIINFLNI